MRGLEIVLYIAIVFALSFIFGIYGFLGSILVLHLFIRSRVSTPYTEYVAPPHRPVIEEEELSHDYTILHVPRQYYVEYRLYLKSQPWFDLRKLAFKRDNHRCVRCGYIGTQKQCHHTSYNGIESMSFTLDQLETVCHLCHTDIHEGILPMKKDT